MISSRFSRSIIIRVFFVVALIIVSYWVPYQVDQSHDSGGTPILLMGYMLVFFLTCVVIGVCTYLLKRVWTIRVGPGQLELRSLFARHVISPGDLKRVELDILARDFRPFFSHINGVEIETVSGERYQLLAQLYGNMPAIRQALEHYFVLSKQEAFVVQPPPRSASCDREEEGHALLFGRGWLFNYSNAGWLFLIFMVFLGYREGHRFLASLMFALSILYLIGLLYLIGGGTMYYFRVSSTYLIIRNYYFPWYRRAYRLSDIRSATRESAGRGNYRLGLTMGGFYRKRFYSAVLRDSEWGDLLDKLEHEGVKRL